MSVFGSAEGSLGAAIAALLGVLGYRFARPSSVREGLALVAYIAALLIVFLRARGVIAGPPVVAGVGLRLCGALLLVVGLLVAGSGSRTRRPQGPATTSAGRPQLRTWIGLVIVLAGYLARAPSTGGGFAVIVAAGFAAFAASAHPGSSR